MAGGLEAVGRVQGAVGRVQGARGRGFYIWFLVRGPGFLYEFESPYRILEGKRCFFYFFCEICRNCRLERKVQYPCGFAARQ